MKSIAKIDTADVTLTKDRLDELEATVRDGSRAFIAVGTALAEIRDGKGYKLRGYDTFEAYCEKVHGISDRHGRRLIQATETAKAVSQIVGQVPGSESVARELAPVAADPKKVEKVAAALEKRGYSVVTATAEAVKEAVEKIAPKKREATPGNGRAVTVEGKATRAAAAPDLAFVARVLNRALPYVRADAGLAEDVRRAAAFVRDLAERGGTGAATAASKCPQCRQAVAPGETFCGNCGAVL